MTRHFYQTLALLFFLTAYCTLYKPVYARQSAGLEIIYQPNAVLSPGGQLRIGVVATNKRGKVKRTRGYADGKQKWSNYAVTVYGGRMVGEGLVLIESDPAQIQGHQVQIHVQSRKDPKLLSHISLPLTYQAAQAADFSGEQGSDTKSRGGRVVPLRIFGSGVASGKEGYAGEPGQHADSIHVYVKAEEDSLLAFPVLKVEVRSSEGDRVERYLINPDGGSLLILADGGIGGTGGEGGPGTDGRDGIEKNRDGSDGTDGGHGGDGGRGGDGGHITFHIDPTAEALMTAIDYSNQGGLGGRGGAGGEGGAGGIGGDGYDNGISGQWGDPGLEGQPGADGPEPLFITQQVVLDW